jgi:hypothetical protein
MFSHNLSHIFKPDVGTRNNDPLVFGTFGLNGPQMSDGRISDIDHAELDFGKAWDFPYHKLLDDLTCGKGVSRD